MEPRAQGTGDCETSKTARGRTSDFGSHKTESKGFLICPIPYAPCPMPSMQRTTENGQPTVTPFFAFEERADNGIILC